MANLEANVVGAGPAGMTAAITLAQGMAGIRFSPRPSGRATISR